MIEIREAIVVEGKYDKIALEPLVNTEIFTTDGFGIFRNKEKMALLRRVAERRGLIVLTDSDGAGLVIRNRLRGSIDGKYLKHAYIPDIPGKEKRKDAPSRAGTLGVEGMERSVLETVLLRAGATPSEERPRITRADLYSLGLSGGTDSAAQRKKLQRALELPERMSAPALLEALNALYTREELMLHLQTLQQESDHISQQEDSP